MAAEDDTLHQLHHRAMTSRWGRLKEYDAYYEGEQPLSYMHPS